MMQNEGQDEEQVEYPKRIFPWRGNRPVPGRGSEKKQIAQNLKSCEDGRNRYSFYGEEGTKI